MELKEQISIDEFDGKRFQIRLVEPSDNRKAVLTHYLHNMHNGVSKYPPHQVHISRIRN
jgi:DNA (cytosine-5)-methyltransferase 1